MTTDTHPNCVNGAKTATRPPPRRFEAHDLLLLRDTSKPVLLLRCKCGLLFGERPLGKRPSAGKEDKGALGTLIAELLVECSRAVTEHHAKVGLSCFKPDSLNRLCHDLLRHSMANLDFSI